MALVDDNISTTMMFNIIKNLIEYWRQITVLNVDAMVIGRFLLSLWRGFLYAKWRQMTL